VLTHRDPRWLIRGLMHSDGSRYVARQRAHGRIYAYPRYDFCNRSDDIKAILCEHLDLLGLSWSRPNAWKVQVARREAVARLDAFVGPKS
jgi:hypothetical protein